MINLEINQINELLICLSNLVYVKVAIFVFMQNLCVSVSKTWYILHFKKYLYRYNSLSTANSTLSWKQIILRLKIDSFINK